MKYLVTGATGFLGSLLVSKLLSHGHRVTGLYRNPAKLPAMNADRMEFVRGDILDYESLVKAASGCDGIFHTAAFTEVWARDKEIIRHVNVGGTMNVMNAALKNCVRKVILTSTAGVFGPSDEAPVNENSVRTCGYFIPYESTKAEAEKRILELSGSGTEVSIVHPTRVYGPGPLNTANSVTRIIDMYLEGKWRFIIGDGSSRGNYVFVDDVIEGHVLAMEKGLNGERYLLGGEDVTYNEFFSILADAAGAHLRLIRIPIPAAVAVARSAVFFASITGTNPFITPGHVRRYSSNWTVSSVKAQESLGYNITPLKEGMDKTILWLKGLKALRP